MNAEWGDTIKAAKELDRYFNMPLTQAIISSVCLESVTHPDNSDYARRVRVWLGRAFEDIDRQQAGCSIIVYPMPQVDG